MPTSGESPNLGSSLSGLAPNIADHELLCLIGRGAYGEVWMARNVIGTLRAIKIVHRRRFEQAEDFEREFRGLLKFEPVSRAHEGLVDVLQIGRRDDGGNFYYVMELADNAKSNCSGNGAEGPSSKSQRIVSSEASKTANSDLYSPRTLRTELLARGRLLPAECAALGLKLASALQHLHSNGLVHRDVKPSNIIFVRGEPKLADIGLVTAIDEAHSLVGTAGYIPPEGPGTPQADIYSLGKVLYEIAFGKNRQDFPGLPPDLQSHPDYAALLELNEVILKACESDPRNRYRRAQEMQADLALLQEGKSVKQAQTRKHQLEIIKKLGLVAAVVTLLAMAGSYLKPWRSDYTPKPEAARLYDLGRWYYSQLTPEAHERAFEYLNKAVDTDPKFVRPYGELTLLFAWARMPWVTNEQIRLQQTRQIEDKLVRIAPQSAERCVASSWRRFLERDWRGAEDEIVKAIKLNPDLAVAHDLYCFYLSMQGRIAEAKRIGQRAQELEPPSSARVTAIVASWPFLAERRFDRSIAQLQRVLELDPNFASGYSYLGDCYEAQSNYVSAIEAYKKAELLMGRDPVRVNSIYGALSDAWKAQGQQGYFRKRIELAVADAALPDNQRFLRDFSWWDTAGYYAQLGEKEKALDELTKHFDEPQVWQQIKFRPLYDKLHNEERFKKLVKQAGLQP